jgi:hypothetical protein
MDQETASAAPGTDWDSGSDSVAAEAETETPEATPEVATDETAPVGEASETTEPSDGSPEPEPVGAVADARVVMPRSTGTGSWLRWPNSTADRSDQSR